jgi:hypothetical protein
LHQFQAIDLMTLRFSAFLDPEDGQQKIRTAKLETSIKLQPLETVDYFT